MNLGNVIPVCDLAGCAIAVVEVVERIKPWILILFVLGSGPTLDGTCGHVVDHGIDDDGDPGLIAGGNHAGKLGACAQLRLEFVTHRLVVDPPLRTQDVFLRRAHLNPVVAGRTEVCGAFLGQRIPGPLEHLHANALLCHYLSRVAGRCDSRRQQHGGGSEG